MIPPHSYSSLKMLKTCPHQWYRSYVKKDLPFYESPEMKWGNRVHTALELRLRDKAPLPEDMQAHEAFALALDPYNPEVELKLGVNLDGYPCDFFSSDVYLRGKLDAVICAHNCILFDWKTGKPYEDSFELRLQALLLRLNRYKIERIIGHYVWLKEGRLGERHDLSTTSDTWHEVNRLHKKAVDYDAKQEWPKVANKLCGWCRVHDCEHNPERVHEDA